MKFSVAAVAAAGLFATFGSLVSSPAFAAGTPADAMAQAPGQGDALTSMLSTLEIGSPLPEMPDCADHRTPNGRDVTALCVELRGDGTMRQIGVPRDKRPVFMDGPHLLGFVDGNALVGVIIPTDGIRSQDAAMQSLSARYGKPFRQEQEDLRDKAGKTVKATHAGWMRKPLTVEFYAIPDDPSEGTIELLLPRARALMANRDAEVAKSLAPASGPAAKGGKAADKPAEKAADKNADKSADKKAPVKPVDPGKW